MYVWCPPMYLHMLLSNGTWTLTTLVLTRKTMNNDALTTNSCNKQQSKDMILKRILRTRNSWFFFLQWCRALDHQTYRKNQEKPPTTTKNTKATVKKNRKTPFSNYLSKSRIRGFSWCLQCFLALDHQNHRKNQENHQKPRQTTKTTVKKQGNLI